MGKSKSTSKANPPKPTPPPPETHPTAPTKSSSHPKPSPQPQQSTPLDQQEQDSSFDSHYLRLLTTYFASDIDKIRRAPDFTSASVPVLIQALKQGAYGFTEEEKRVVMGGKGGGKMGEREGEGA